MLSKELRLKNTKEIKDVFTKGKSTRCGFLFLKCSKNSLPLSRFTVSIGLPYSKSAVKRNSLKRKIRKEIEKNLGSIKNGFDCVFFVRGVTSQNIELSILEKSVSDCFKKTGLLKNK